MISQALNLNNISIILHKPKFPENIGSTARAMKNMGLKNLSVIDPFNCDLTTILKLATHKAIDIIENMQLYDNIKDALLEYSYIVGTTARLGGERSEVKNPTQMAHSLIPISKKNKIAIIFGPEDRGLSNNEIKYCQIIVNIPTSEFSSLNVSQAVLLICYELFAASRIKTKSFIPRIADFKEQEAMYVHLQEALTKIDFIKHDTKDHWMLNIRKFFGRLHLRGRDVKIIRGICRQINWMANQKKSLKPEDIIKGLKPDIILENLDIQSIEQFLLKKKNKK